VSGLVLQLGILEVRVQKPPSAVKKYGVEGEK